MATTSNFIIKIGGTTYTVVANYSALPDPTTVSGKFYWVSNAQGTSWLPGSLGGTYYNSGLYYSNGTTWEFINVPFQATQDEVNTGTNTDKFVTPATLKNTTSIPSGVQTALNGKESKTEVFTLTSPYALTSQTALQSFMGHSFNVVAGTYRFKLRFRGSSFAASGNIQFGTLGTATVTFISWDSNANKQNSFPNTNQIEVGNSTSVSAITTASASTLARGLVEGVVTFSTSGTFILAIAMGTAAAASIEAGTQELTLL